MSIMKCHADSCCQVSSRGLATINKSVINAWCRIRTRVVYNTLDRFWFWVKTFASWESSYRTGDEVHIRMINEMIQLQWSWSIASDDAFAISEILSIYSYIIRYVYYFMDSIFDLSCLIFGEIFHRDVVAMFCDCVVNQSKIEQRDYVSIKSYNPLDIDIIRICDIEEQGSPRSVWWTKYNNCDLCMQC